MTDKPDAKHGTLKELAEDASGFGMGELRLTRDLILRPARAMDAYDEQGSTAGGLYPRPMRYYIGLNGLILLITALTGGSERTLSTSEPQVLEAWVKASGKTRDAFIADFDQWFSLLSVPLYTLVMVLPLFFLIQRWSPLRWRADLGQTFTFLNAWTLYQMPIMVAFLIDPVTFKYLGVPLMLVLVLVVYARVGRERWWRTPVGAWLKGLLLLVVTILAMLPASFIVYFAAFTLAAYLP